MKSSRPSPESSFRSLSGIGNRETGNRIEKMFGGLAFMLSGNMCVGISGDDLMVRIGPDSQEEALSHAGVRVFDMTGRPMRGWILVAGSVLEPDDALSDWVERGVDFAGTLPPK